MDAGAERGHEALRRTQPHDSFSSSDAIVRSRSPAPRLFLPEEDLHPRDQARQPPIRPIQAPVQATYSIKARWEWNWRNMSTKIFFRTEKELNKCKDMLSNLRSKAKQMGSTLNMSNFASREDLLGRSKRSADEIDRTAGLDNHGIVGFQRQVMKEQDQGLEKLEETVFSTKHIALAVNEELDLHTRLIGDLDQHVDSTDSRLQRVQKRLAILNKRTKGGCSCKSLLILVIVIVILAVVIWLLIKYL
ncbi:syntaxin-52-like isoform X1 [Iris pallida]|uniref:Syntaxin-52-like isoform X1 n=1 Tax=Iris pallida TaxID=29817 RepID=A0AAX6H2W1_IRIPA|nr:syntaxin-52-like isoform X1 [Iris pallida]